MAVHTCTDCGLIHDALVADEREPMEVTLRRLAKEEAIEVAKINARVDREYNETRIEVAEIETEAMVEAAVVEGEVIAAAIEASDVPAAEPIDYVAPDLIVDQDVDVDQELPEIEGSPVPDDKKSAGLGMW
jgi:hypothetical protein